MLILTHFSTCWSVLCESSGQYCSAFKVSQEHLSVSKARPHLFLFAPSVFGFYSTLLCISSPDTSLHFDSLPNEGLQQQRPTLLYQEIDELLLNPWGGYVFPPSCQEVGRSEDDSSPLNGPDFRSIQSFRLIREAKHTLLWIIFSVIIVHHSV